MKIMEKMAKAELFYVQEAVKIGHCGEKERIRQAIAVEYDLELHLNGKYWKTLVCTPTYLAELALGHLLSEGVIRSAGQVESLYVREAEGIADFRGEFCVPGAGKQAGSPGLSVEGRPAGCREDFSTSTSERQEAKAFPSLDSSLIFRMLETMSRELPLHELTRSAHGCCLAMEGEPLFVCEDIKRHNALDKAIGYALRQGYDRKQAILYTTGRAPVDLVQKVIRSGIPVLVSKRLPTREAVELAARHGIILIGRAGQDGVQVFSRP